MANLILSFVEAKDVGGREGIDAYIQATFREETFRTNVSYNTRNPKWSSRVVVEMPGDKAPKDDWKLFIELKHHDPLHGDPLQAHLTLDLRKIPKKEAWFKFDAGSGELHVKITPVSAGVAELADGLVRPRGVESEEDDVDLDRLANITATLFAMFCSKTRAAPDEDPSTVKEGQPRVLSASPLAPSGKRATPLQHFFSPQQPARVSSAPAPTYVTPSSPQEQHKIIRVMLPSNASGTQLYPVGTSALVQNLMAMFPQFDANQILAVLKKNNFNKEATVNDMINALQSLAQTTPNSQKLQSSGKYHGAPQQHEHFDNFVRVEPPSNPAGIHHDDTKLTVPHSEKQHTMEASGRRKALIIGVNYLGTANELRGCIQDAQRIKHMLTEVYGFQDNSGRMVVMTDDTTDSRLMPTRANMILGMKWLVRGAKAGDVLFFHFSGHGSQSPDKSGYEADGMDETIMASDWQTAGPLIDDDINELLVQPLASGAKLVAVMDCCHSGTGMDLPFQYNKSTGKWATEQYPLLSEGDVTLITGCRSDQTSADVQGADFGAGGALTLALIASLSANPFGFTYPRLIDQIHSLMDARGFPQRPQTSSSQQYDLKSREFNFTEIVTNTNPYKGRQGRKITTKPAQPPMVLSSTPGGYIFQAFQQFRALAA